ncbi:AAA family ATPase [Methylobacter sp. S3L5C]|uniref:AAA family ATPase n=1 Tax=Methylobacter sp. S3L5C TaxID=2839024 RepID=UPI001FABA4E0|nr:AAA family ATPase [Methylobacter sp. S3L5C]UOA07548.1 ATP-binding protein [Methylobacter sp. S3L5C]
MADNDTVKYHEKKSLIDQQSRVFHSLITQERTQKLELVIHLLSNSNQALVVCGPSGIGKSTLLSILQERKLDSWLYCPILGNTGLNFEKIQERIISAITDNKSRQKSRSLSGAFGLLESQHKKIVLVIDEAGYLPPGLINTIISYVQEQLVLQVIFVLTHDDLSIKNSSDSAIDDCHLIEIPPLSEKQCGEFLQYLAIKPRSPIAFNGISDAMIETVYLETHGIPGRIIGNLPKLKNTGKNNNSLWVLIAGVLGLIILALCIQWFSSSEYNSKPLQATPSNTQ